MLAVSQVMAVTSLVDGDGLLYKVTFYIGSLVNNTTGSLFPTHSVFYVHLHEG